MPSYIRGYHEYRDLLVPVVGQVLNCYQEPDNVEDNEAVDVKENSDIFIFNSKNR